jgi:hypothetical protein
MDMISTHGYIPYDYNVGQEAKNDQGWRINDAPDTVTKPSFGDVIKSAFIKSGSVFFGVLVAISVSLISIGALIPICIKTDGKTHNFVRECWYFVAACLASVEAKPLTSLGDYLKASAAHAKAKIDELEMRAVIYGFNGGYGDQLGNIDAIPDFNPD